jgi:hypothetical protein
MLKRNFANVYCRDIERPYKKMAAGETCGKATDIDR